MYNCTHTHTCSSLSFCSRTCLLRFSSSAWRALSCVKIKFMYMCTCTCTYSTCTLVYSKYTLIRDKQCINACWFNYARHAMCTRTSDPSVAIFSNLARMFPAWPPTIDNKQHHVYTIKAKIWWCFRSAWTKMARYMYSSIERHEQTERVSDSLVWRTKIEVPGKQLSMSNKCSRFLSRDDLWVAITKHN